MLMITNIVHVHCEWCDGEQNIPMNADEFTCVHCDLINAKITEWEITSNES